MPYFRRKGYEESARSAMVFVSLTVRICVPRTCLIVFDTFSQAFVRGHAPLVDALLCVT